MAQFHAEQPRRRPDFTGLIIRWGEHAPDLPRFMYAGMMYDPETAVTLNHDGDTTAQTGLYHATFRDYDPASGTWTSADPLGAAGSGTNLHAYVGNDPLDWSDPWGLSAISAPGTNYGYGLALGSAIGSLFNSAALGGAVGGLVGNLFSGGVGNSAASNVSSSVSQSDLDPASFGFDGGLEKISLTGDAHPATWGNLATFGGASDPNALLTSDVARESWQFGMSTYDVAGGKARDYDTYAAMMPAAEARWAEDHQVQAFFSHTINNATVGLSDWSGGTESSRYTGANFEGVQAAAMFAGPVLQTGLFAAAGAITRLPGTIAGARVAGEAGILGGFGVGEVAPIRAAALAAFEMSAPVYRAAAAETFGALDAFSAGAGTRASAFSSLSTRALARTGSYGYGPGAILNSPNFGRITVSDQFYHAQYVQQVLGRDLAGEVWFQTPMSSSRTGLGSRRYDAFDLATNTAFEGNTTPWELVDPYHLQRKIAQVGSDFALRGAGRIGRNIGPVQRVIWFGTHELPETGLAGQLNRALRRANIPYYVVNP